VEFSLSADALSFMNESMQCIVEPGLFEIMVGSNSVDLQTVQLEVGVKS
jgi:beta-glucosidase